MKVKSAVRAGGSIGGAPQAVNTPMADWLQVYSTSAMSPLAIVSLCRAREAVGRAFPTLSNG